MSEERSALSAAVAGFPAGVLSVDEAEGSVTVGVEAGLYPLEAVYGAAYVFLDRCYVFLDRVGERILVALCSKRGDAGAEQLRAMVGEFANELLSQAWRAKITESNRLLIETVTTQALAGALGPPSLDELAAFDFGDEPLDDPLGIAMSWEEKYRKKAPDAVPTEEPGPAGTEPGGGEEAP